MQEWVRIDNGTQAGSTRWERAAQSQGCRMGINSTTVLKVKIADRSLSGIYS